MNILLIDGFDLYNGIGANAGVQSKWALNSTFQMVTEAGRFDGQSFGTSVTTGRQLNRPLAAASASISVGFAYKVTSLPSGNTAFLHFLSDTTYMVGLYVNADGSISAGRFTSLTAATVLATSVAAVIRQDTWHYIEAEITISDTVGVFNVYVDGEQVIALTNVDTRNGTPTTVNKIQLGSTTTAFLIDDLYVTDTAVRLGERRVQTLRPSADTATKNFVPSTGTSNYAMVDDVLADATDYVTGSTVGDLDLYELANIGGTPSVIDAVQIIAFAHKTDAASRNLALVADIAGTQNQSGNFALAASDMKLEYLLQAKPGGGAWDLAAVNALRIGPKVTL